MPYIDAESRAIVDEQIKALVAKLDHFTAEEIEGVLNYTITQILNARMTKDGRWRYKKINRVIGVLECIKLEFYRRLAGPYEDGAIQKNGDLPCYDPRRRGKDERSSISS